MNEFLQRLTVLFAITLLMMATLSPMNGAIAQEFQNNSSSENELPVTSLNDSQESFNFSEISTLIIQQFNETVIVDSDGDRLPDYYEINVTGTDPLRNDSDSSLTAIDEALNGTEDGREDFDHDLISNYGEYKIGTDPFNEDTDGDGLIDSNEVYVIGTSPLISDTDGNGINDGAEDPDHDGLTSLSEQELGTNPLSNDTDGDTLSDSDELNLYHTNPSRSDTDGDRLADNTEIELGSDPLSQDTNGNGIPDGSDTFSQTFSDASLGVAVQATGIGELQSTMDIKKNLYPYAPLARLSGIVSDFIDVNASSGFDSAIVRVYYDEARLNGSSESSLKLYYFDESTLTPVEAYSQTLDTTSNYIETTNGSPGTWFIADPTLWTTTAIDLQEKPARTSITDTSTNAMDNGLMYGTQTSSSSALTFEQGDTINIMARIHNLGDANIDGNIAVYFYEGDPEDDGVPIGTASITGGIPANSSKVAIMHNYVIHADAVDIYVQADPQGAINESDELDNVAFRLLSTGSQDSDGDGLSDTEETSGMTIRAPYGVVYSDPYSNDTDEDGLEDGFEMGEKLYDSNGVPYYDIVSYPDNSDSDGDGLSDYEEVNDAQTVYIANTPAKVQELFSVDLTQVDVTTILSRFDITTSPINGDCDHDGISDGDEIINGTNPQSADSDGDHILDGVEAIYGEDPTLFDINAPTVTDTVTVWKPSGSADAMYNVMVSAGDPGGVKNIKVLKNGGEKYGYYSPGRSTGVGFSTSFMTPWWETILDEFGTTRVDIYADDWNNNANSTIAYSRPSMVGQWTTVLSQYAPDPEGFASCMGLMSGSYNDLKQVPESAIQLCQNPLAFVDGIKQVASTLASDPGYIDDMIAEMANSIKQQQKLENPYDPYAQETLHNAFERGWYTGYVVTEIIQMVAGGAVFKNITTSGEFVQLTTGIMDKISDVKNTLRASTVFKTAGRAGVTTKFAAMLVLLYASTTFAADDVVKVTSKVETAVGKERATRCVASMNVEIRSQITDYLPEMGAIANRYGGSSVSFVQTIGGVPAQKLLSLSSDTGLVGRVENKLREMSMNPNFANRVPDLIDNLDKLKSINKFDALLKRVATSNEKAFKGVIAEIEFTASKNPDNVIGIGLEVVGRYGKTDIDAFVTEVGETTKNIAYEIKDVDFAQMDIKSLNNFKSDIMAKRSKIQSLIDNHIPVDGDRTIDRQRC